MSEALPSVCRAVLGRVWTCLGLRGGNVGVKGGGGGGAWAISLEEHGSTCSHVHAHLGRSRLRSGGQQRSGYLAGVVAVVSDTHPLVVCEGVCLYICVCVCVCVCVQCVRVSMYISECVCVCARVCVDKRCVMYVLRAVLHF